jgi:transposase-like protein
MTSYTEQERQEHIENWTKGGLTKASYAKSVGLKKETLYYWLKRKARNKNQSFIEIPKKVLPTNIQDMVIEKGNITVRVPLSVGIKELQTVLTALGGEQ